MSSSPSFSRPFSSPEIVLTSSPDGQIVAFDPSSGTALACFSGSLSPSKGLAVAGRAHIAASHISPDTGACSVHLYNWWSRSAFLHIPLAEPAAPLAATADGSYLFAGGISGNVHALSLPSGEAVRSLRTHERPISCLAISSDGSLLLLGGDDGTVAVVPIFKLVDIESNEAPAGGLIVDRLASHGAPVTAIAVGACGTAVSCSSDGACVFWSLVHGTRRQRMVAFPCGINAMAMDPTESEFYVGASDGWLYSGAIKVTSRQQAAAAAAAAPVRWGEQHGGGVVALAVVGGGRNLVTASEGGSVWVWGVEERRVVGVLELGDHHGVSELVVARGMGQWRSWGGACGDREGSGLGLWLPAAAAAAAAREIPGSEGRMSREAVRSGRRKAIEMLEAAIKMYEKLLQLILREVSGGNNPQRMQPGPQR